MTKTTLATLTNLKDFRENLAVLRKLHPKGDTPHTKYFLLRTSKASGKIEAVVTDLAITRMVEVEGVVESEGEVLVSLEATDKMLKALEKAGGHLRVLLEASDKSPKVLLEHTDLLSTLPTIPPSEFPNFSYAENLKGTSCSMEAGTFVRALESVLKASAATSHYRTYLSSVFFAEDSLVATDGHRLRRYQVPGVQGSFPSDFLAERQALDVATFAAKKIKKGQVTLTFDSEAKCFEVEAGPYRIVGRQSQERFPFYEDAIPKSKSENILWVNRNDCIKRIEMVATLCGPDQKIRFSHEPEGLSISTTSDGAKSRSLIPVKVPSDTMVVSFNFKYVLDALQDLASDEVGLELMGELKPGIFHEREVQAGPFFQSETHKSVWIVMPMRNLD
jgi:DNA polymerase III subunit beta